MGRGQKCENGECTAATIHCQKDGDCLTTDHFCDDGVCELRGKGGGKSAPAPKKSKSGSKSKSRSSSRDRGSGGGHSGSRSASADRTGLETEDIDLFADHIGCVWDGSGCHNDLCDQIQMESRCQALSHDQDDCLGAEGMNKRCVWKHGLSEE